MSAAHTFRDGDAVVFLCDEERYPHFVVPKGTTGVVLDAGWGGDPDAFLVKVDGEVPGLTDNEEWCGEYQWYPSNGGENPVPAFLGHIEHSQRRGVHGTPGAQEG